MKKIIFLCMLLPGVWACSKDDNKRLTPSGAEVDWFEIKPGSTELDQMRYDIYQTYNISVYYNDTLGSQLRGIDGYGEPIIHHELLTPCYNMSSNTRTITYGLSNSESNLMEGVTLIKEKVLPRMAKSIYPRSFLLAEKLILDANQTAANGRRAGSAYHGLMTTVVGCMDEIADMTEDEKNALVAQVIACIIYDKISTDKKTELTEFQAVSLTSVPSTITQVYDVLVKSANTTPYSVLPYSAEGWTAYGFLVYNTRRSATINSVTGVATSFYTPLVQQDVLSFLEAALLYSADEFETLYGTKGGYPYLKEKFEIMQDMIKEYLN